MDNFIEQLNAEFDVEATYKKLNKISTEKQRNAGFTYWVEEIIVQTLNEAHNISVNNIQKYHNWLLENYSLVPKSDNKD